MSPHPPACFCAVETDCVCVPPSPLIVFGSGGVSRLLFCCLSLLLLNTPVGFELCACLLCLFQTYACSAIRDGSGHCSRSLFLLYFVYAAVSYPACATTTAAPSRRPGVTRIIKSCLCFKIRLKNTLKKKGTHPHILLPEVKEPLCPQSPILNQGNRSPTDPNPGVLSPAVANTV